MPKLITPVTFKFFAHSVPDLAPLPYVSIFFGYVQPDGTFDSSSFTDASGNSNGVEGTFDVTSGNIRFNDAAFPGLILMTTYFTGTSLAASDGSVAALFGSWTEQQLTFDEREKRNLLRVRHRTGPWMATNPTYPVL
jgi:hypothetical protein